MKRLCPLAACVLMLLLLIATANAGPNGSPGNAKAQGKVRAPDSNQGGQSGEIRPVTPDMNWREKVMMQREIKKRGAASRNALMRKAAMKKQEQRRNAREKTQQMVK